MFSLFWAKYTTNNQTVSQCKFRYWYWFDNSWELANQKFITWGCTESTNYRYFLVGFRGTFFNCCHWCWKPSFTLYCTSLIAFFNPCGYNPSTKILFPFLLFIHISFENPKTDFNSLPSLYRLHSRIRNIFLHVLWENHRFGHCTCYYCFMFVLVIRKCKLILLQFFKGVFRNDNILEKSGGTHSMVTFSCPGIVWSLLFSGLMRKDI